LRNQFGMLSTPFPRQERRPGVAWNTPLYAGCAHLLQMDDRHIGLLKKFECIGIDSVLLCVYNPSDARLDDLFGAQQAGEVRHIQHRAICADAEPGALYDGVAFRMDRANAVPVHHLTANFLAVYITRN